MSRGSPFPLELLQGAALDRVRSLMALSGSAWRSVGVLARLVLTLFVALS